MLKMADTVRVSDWEMHEAERSDLIGCMLAGYCAPEEHVEEGRGR